MTQECFQEFAPTCVNRTSATHDEDEYTLMAFPLQLTVNRSKAWYFHQFVLQLGLFCTRQCRHGQSWRKRRKKAEQRAVNRRVSKDTRAERSEIDNCLATSYIDKISNLGHSHPDCLDFANKRLRE